ncbi:MAG: ADP-ribosylglycohydrolase family protein [Pseudomonadales bacterium]|nr:ADP-ribosylglycohydrolase family protein [Pseudomonadales bacterium]
MTDTELLSQRVVCALKTAFIGDALAMPVHWYYNPADIFHQFPDGIRQFEDAPEHHPSSIMSLHSTSQGGRRQRASGSAREIIGEVILKGRRQFWEQPGCHYHHGMTAGQNTLNAHCARVLLRTLAEQGGQYHQDRFLDAYIAFMTADPPRHPDTYAESYHRGFFANLEAGKPASRCGAVTHDTASIGGLVGIVPLALTGLLQGTSRADVQERCRQHLLLTHPDQDLAQICGYLVRLLDALLRCQDRDEGRDILNQCAHDSAGLDLHKLTKKCRSDREVIGGLFSPACYISGSWPGVLYLAYRYLGESDAGLLANANLGGDNVHRGFVLGSLLGLLDSTAEIRFFQQLKDRHQLTREFEAILPETRIPQGSTL